MRQASEVVHVKYRNKYPSALAAQDRGMEVNGIYMS
jgi:hypothetical protein